MIPVYSEVSGEDFNILYGDTKFYKFLNNDLAHYDYVYNLGLNINIEYFRPCGTCIGGGLYFCDESNCHTFWKNYGTKLAFVSIPQNARVYIEHNKFKADRIIIDDIKDFDDVSDEFWIRILSKDTSALQFIKGQTDDICRYAIRQNYSALQFVRDQTDDICRFAIQVNSNALEFVRDQSREICMLAIWNDGLVLKYVIDQTNEICRLAVWTNGLALEYVKNQTNGLCKIAVQQNGLAIQHVEKSIITKGLCELADRRL